MADKIAAKAKEFGDKLGAAAVDTAEAIGEKPKAAGADAMQGVGRAVRNAADQIGDDAPAVAEYVRDAAAGIDKVAKGLRDNSVGELLDMAAKFGREQPIVLFAGAAVVGFALSRFMKSSNGKSTPQPDGETVREADAFPHNGGIGG